jgi:hypothetical protein
MEDAAKVLAQTAVQDSHIIRNPSPTRDIAPSTSADQRPITVIRDALPSIQFSSSSNLHMLSQLRADADEDTVSEVSLEDSTHDISPKPRRPQLPPIPDLRFEQSYLKQLEAAKGSVMWIIIITIREQVLFPGVQGFLWALAMSGIRSLRTRQAESGQEWGGWIREFFGQFKKTDLTMSGNRRR